jgi:hypothetical protein
MAGCFRAQRYLFEKAAAPEIGETQAEFTVEPGFALPGKLPVVSG